MRGMDSVVPFSNAGAGTSAAFKLQGGRYLLTLNATGSGGTVTLQKLGPDGATYATVIPAVGSALTAAGTVLYDLPAGQYQLVIGTLTANSAEVVRVPGD